MTTIKLDENEIAVVGTLTRFDHLEKLVMPSKAVLSKDVVFNLTQLELVDTAGLAWLLQAKVQLAEQSINLIFSNPSDKLIQLAGISGINEILGI